jgi:hypothetical protein
VGGGGGGSPALSSVAQVLCVRDTWHTGLAIHIWRRIAVRPAENEIWDAYELLLLHFVSGPMLPV